MYRRTTFLYRRMNLLVNHPPGKYVYSKNGYTYTKYTIAGTFAP